MKGKPKKPKKGAPFRTEPPRVGYNRNYPPPPGQVPFQCLWVIACYQWVSSGLGGLSHAMPNESTRAVFLNGIFFSNFYASIWFVDYKTVVFFSKSVKKSVKRGVRVLRVRSARAGVWDKRKKKRRSLPSFALCFHPRSRPFVWLLESTWIRKNTECFAVYLVWNWVRLEFL